MTHLQSVGAVDFLAVPEDRLAQCARSADNFGVRQDGERSLNQEASNGGDFGRKNRAINAAVL